MLQLRSGISYEHLNSTTGNTAGRRMFIVVLDGGLHRDCAEPKQIYWIVRQASGPTLPPFCPLQVICLQRTEGGVIPNQREGQIEIAL